LKIGAARSTAGLVAGISTTSTTALSLEKTPDAGRLRASK